MSKETRLNIRITPAQKENFDSWCKENGTTPSDEIRRYIVKLTKIDKEC
jgi:antitoxin component of RelBE/YafQ-DinJ toxin-antitoxin module